MCPVTIASMESALQHAGKQVTAFYPELADAGMNHSAERVLWATELEKLLAGTIGAGGVKTAGSGSP